MKSKNGMLIIVQISLLLFGVQCIGVIIDVLSNKNIYQETYNYEGEPFIPYENLKFTFYFVVLSVLLYALNGWYRNRKSS